MQKDNTAWFTPVEVAERLKVDPATVRRWLKAGHVRGSHLGRVWRVGDADLAAFMESRVPEPGTVTDDDADQ